MSSMKTVMQSWAFGAPHSPVETAAASITRALGQYRALRLSLSDICERVPPLIRQVVRPEAFEADANALLHALALSSRINVAKILTAPEQAARDCPHYELVVQVLAEMGRALHAVAVSHPVEPPQRGAELRQTANACLPAVMSFETGQLVRVAELEQALQQQKVTTASLLAENARLRRQIQGLGSPLSTVSLPESAENAHVKQHQVANRVVCYTPERPVVLKDSVFKLACPADGTLFDQTVSPGVAGSVDEQQGCAGPLDTTGVDTGDRAVGAGPAGAAFSPFHSAEELRVTEAYLNYVLQAGRFAGDVVAKYLGEIYRAHVRIWTPTASTWHVVDLCSHWTEGAEKTIDLLRYDTHYRCVDTTSQVEMDANRGELDRGFVEAYQVDAGGGGDCLFLAVAYSLDINGFRAKFDQHRCIATNPCVSEVVKHQALVLHARRTAELVGMMRLKMIQHWQQTIESATCETQDRARELIEHILHGAADEATSVVNNAVSQWSAPETCHRGVAAGRLRTLRTALGLLLEADTEIRAVTENLMAAYAAMADAHVTHEGEGSCHNLAM